jgi:hypothetical protein
MVWHEVWATLKQDLPVMKNNFCNFIEKTAHKYSCDFSCSENCEGIPHIDPVVTNYI